MAPGSLNHKQKKFAVAYTTGATAGNATQSAIAAGYSARTAHSCGPRLLENAAVKALIADRTEKAIAKIERTAEKVLDELARLGFSDITAIYNDEVCETCKASRGTLKHPKDMPLDVRRAIKSIEFEELWAGGDGEKFVAGRIVKITLHSKEKGLELLGKNLSLFRDKVEIEVGESWVDMLLAARKGEADE